MTPSFIWSHSQLTFLRAIDGDTVKFGIDMGFNISTIQILRLARINTPELRSKDPKVREKAQSALIFVRDSIVGAKELKLVTYKQGKFGRYLCDIWVDGKNLNKILIDDGFAVAYRKRK